MSTGTAPRAALPGTGDAVVPADDRESLDVRRRLRVCAALTVAVAVLAVVPAGRTPAGLWAALLLTAPVALWGAHPVHRAALARLREGRATADTLVSLGVLAAFGWSLGALLFGSAGRTGHVRSLVLATVRTDPTGQTHLEIAAALATAALLGRHLVLRARPRDAVAADPVAVLREGGEEVVPADRLAVGDRMVVRPGDRLRADGVVESGTAVLDLALLVGSAQRRETGPGDEVAAGSVASDSAGPLVVRAVRVGADTDAARMAALAGRARDRRAAAAVRAADEVCAGAVPLVVAVAVAAGGFWWGAGAGGAVATAVAVGVLVVACPLALAPTSALALLAGVRAGARLGVRAASPVALETAHGVDTVLIDGTGTLTSGPAGGGAPDVHPDAAAAVAGLRDLGLEPVLVSAGSAADARALAVRAGIDPDAVVAGTTPGDRVDAVRRLQESGRVVALVADGADDGAALAAADLGIAVGPGAEVAGHAADLVLARADPLLVVDAVRLCRSTAARARAGVRWAFVAGPVVAVPLAAAGLLSPAAAGAAAAVGAVVVVAHGLRAVDPAPAG